MNWFTALEICLRLKRPSLKARAHNSDPLSMVVLHASAGLFFSMTTSGSIGRRSWLFLECTMKHCSLCPSAICQSVWSLGHTRTDRHRATSQSCRHISFLEEILVSKLEATALFFPKPSLGRPVTCLSFPAFHFLCGVWGGPLKVSPPPPSTWLLNLVAFLPIFPVFPVFVFRSHSIKVSHSDSSGLSSLFLL